LHGVVFVIFVLTEKNWPKKKGETTMINRRQFVYAGAAGAALLGRMPTARAATYDLVIKGGRVIDRRA
jgi:hypothetical protein